MATATFTLLDNTIAQNQNAWSAYERAGAPTRAIVDAILQGVYPPWFDPSAQCFIEILRESFQKAKKQTTHIKLVENSHV